MQKQTKFISERPVRDRQVVRPHREQGAAPQERARHPTDVAAAAGGVLPPLAGLLH